MDLPFKPHFAIECPTCKECISTDTELTPEQREIAAKDPTAALRSLDAATQKAFVKFYVDHKNLGHEPEPIVMGIAPIPKA
jgi:hypothetical protein